jgi:hypothetical protein
MAPIRWQRSTGPACPVEEVITSGPERLAQDQAMYNTKHLDFVLYKLLAELSPLMVVIRLKVIEILGRNQEPLCPYP